MSSLSRRSLLGYSGSAAGAALASGGTAQPATAEAAAESTTPASSASAERQAEAAAVEFPPGTEFSGASGPSVPEQDTWFDLRIRFTVEVSDVNGGTLPPEHAVSPADIANALSEFAASKGRPPITFSGRPVPVAVNGPRRPSHHRHRLPSQTAADATT